MKNHDAYFLTNRLSIVRNRRRGFTLVELLVVICLIAVLAALTFTTLGKIRQSSRSTRCVVNLRQIYLASQIYSQENNSQVLPGESWNGGTHLFWHWILRPALGGTSVFDDKVDPSFRCMEIKPGNPNFWAWGYGANSKPGMEGASTTSTQGSYNAEQVNVSNPTNWQRSFRQVEITQQSRRLFICDAKEWQVTPSATGQAAFPDYTRHGNGKCNVLFFDGHIGSLNKIEVNKALYNPGG
ncbi:MAG: prepilin-type N-terminal cleavage/methylation domain-containing protein [Luteolibacter sp.]